MASFVTEIHATGFATHAFAKPESTKRLFLLPGESPRQDEGERHNHLIPSLSRREWLAHEEI